MADIEVQPTENTEIETEEPKETETETEYLTVEHETDQKKEDTNAQGQEVQAIQAIPQTPSVDIQQEIQTVSTNKTYDQVPVDNMPDKAYHVDDEEDDNEDDEDMFDGSTHTFAVYFGDLKKRNTNGCIVAIFIILTQFVLYIVFASEVLGGMSGDEFLIPVQVRFSKPCSGTDAQLICPPYVPNLGFVALAAILLSIFLMHDIMASLRIFTTIHDRYAKIAAVVLLSEALMAALIGIFFATAATSGYDAIANCIGVLFIHDLDEKAYEAFMVIQAKSIKRRKCCNDRWWPRFLRFAQTSLIFITAFGIMIIALIVAGAIRGAQVAHVKEEYGDDYWDNQMDGGYYNPFDDVYFNAPYTGY